MPTASIASKYDVCALVSICNTETFISSTSSSAAAADAAGRAVVVPIVIKGNSCSSGNDRSSNGSSESSADEEEDDEGSRGVDALPLMPAVQPQRRPGMGIPASTRARVHAFMAAAKREPSDERTETCTVIVLCG